MCDNGVYGAHRRAARTSWHRPPRGWRLNRGIEPAPRPSSALIKAALAEEGRLGGLLAGEQTEHVSFRAPPALVAAAKRGTGITSTSELGKLALLMLAQPDPVAPAMKRSRGRLGKDHILD